MKLKRRKIDVIIEGLCFAMMFGTLIYLAARWTSLPSEIPMHYNRAGEIDRWGSKWEIIPLVAFEWLMYIVLTAVGQCPQIWNTGVKITEENRDRVYRTLKNMLNTTKLCMVGIFNFLMVNIATGAPLSRWFLPAVLILVFGELAFWLIKLVRVK